MTTKSFNARHGITVGAGNIVVADANGNITANTIVVGGSSLNSTAYAGTANNATYLNGQLASYYTNASNLSTGTIDVLRLPTSGVTANVYGNSSSIPVVTVDTYGRVTSITTSAVASVTSFTYAAANSTFSLGTSGGSSYTATITAANSTVAGVVTVLDSTTNTSITIAASANTVKNAYDRAIDANTRAASAQTAAISAYSNATSYADSAAATAYSNAVSVASADATNKAANAYSNAVSYAATIAGTAYSNAVATAAGDATLKANNAYTTAVSTAASDATNKAANAYSNAVSYAATIAGTAYSNAVSTAAADATSKANNAYTTAVAAAASDATSKANNAYTTAVSAASTDATNKAANAYSNAVTFASNASNISSGTLAEARLPYRMNQNVRTTDTVEFGNMTVTGNLTVSGTTVTVSANNLVLEDNMIYLNDGSTTANPDLGIAGNYNDGTYRHAGFFRDATDGVWKVYDQYLPEPDASPYIDTANASFRIANFQANVVTMASANVGGAIINSTSYTGTANNTAFVGSVAAANVVSNTQLSSNLANYALLSGATFTGKLRYQANTGFDAGNYLYFGYEEHFGGVDTGGLDYGYITYDNNSTKYGSGGGETSVLRIGTSNDGTGVVSDALALEPTAEIYLNPGSGGIKVGNYSSFWTITNGTGLVANTTGLHVNSSYIATLSSNNATYFDGATWASPKALGGTTPNTAVFSSATIQTAAGRVAVGTDAGGSLTIGRLDGTTSTPYIDFNTSATAVDFDARIQVAAGSNTVGSGAMTITALNTTITGSTRSPIFYDSDNTSYYIDPFSLSNVYRINSDGMSGNQFLTGTTNYADVVNGSTWYGIGRANSDLLGGGGNTVQVAGYYGLRMRTSSATLDVYPTYTQASGSLRAPLFYDSNDTTYYLDPAGDSVINNTYVNRYFQRNSGVPTNNLGTPTVTEMALFQEQFDNKTAFYPIANIKLYTSTDGNTWTEYTGFSDTEKRKFVGGNATSGINIPNGTPYFRIEIINDGAYVFLDALYMYWAGHVHSTTVKIRALRGDDVWVQWTNSNTQISSWPGHMYMPFSSIPFINVPGSTSHYKTVHIDFQPTWTTTGEYASLPIALYNMQIWGGYPASKRTIFSVDELKNTTFPGDIRATLLYDTNNTSYYIDPASSSVLNTVTTGILTASSTNDVQLILSGNGTSWAGINWSDVDSSDNIYYRGLTSTFAIGGGGSVVSGKKLHVNGGTTIGSGLGATSVSTNGLLVETRVDAPIFYDSNNTAFYFDGASATNINTLSGNGKTVVETSDTYLRVNQSSSFSSGTWFGSSNILGASGIFALGSNGGTTNSRVYISPGTYNGTNVINLDGSNGRITALDVRAPIFYDTDNTAFFVDPNSTSVMSVVRADTIQRNGGNQAILLNNATYTQFCDPAGTVKFWIGGADAGNYFNNTTHYFRDTASSNQFLIYGSGARRGEYNSADGSLFIRGDAGGWATGLYFVGSSGTTRGGFGALGGGDALTNFWIGTSYAAPAVNIFTDGTVTAIGSHRAPIFYDSQNTAYYLDPSSTAGNAIYVAGGIHVSGANVSGNGIILADDGDIVDLNDGYCAMRFSNGVRIHRGNRTGDPVYAFNTPVGSTNLEDARGFVINGSYTNGQYSSRLRKWDDGGGLPLYVQQTTGTANSWSNVASFGASNARYHFHIDGIGYSNTDWRAPVFYDSDDTGFYLNPASDIRVRAIKVSGEIEYPGSINSDWDGGYYHFSNTQNTPDGNYGHVHIIRLSADWNVQQYWPTANDWSLWFRKKLNGTQGTWHHVMTSTLGRWNTTSEGQDRFFFSSSGRTYYKSGGGHEFRSNADANIGLLDNDGNWYNYVSVRSPIFYDQNNTGFYTDPASTSVMNGLTLSGSLTVGNGANASYIYMADSDEGTRTIHTNSNRIGFLTQAGGWGAWCEDSGVWATDVDMRAPIFYDSNDTGRYLDPNGNSFLVGTTVITRNGNSDDTFGGLEIRENNLQGAATGAATEAPGINFHWSARAAARIYMDASGNFVLGAQSNITSGRRSMYGAAFFAASEVQSPIYYDSNNTAYYVNPNGSTSLRTVGDWRSDSSAWTGEFSGKIQYHDNSWYLQASGRWEFRRSDTANAFSVTQAGVAQALGDFRAPIFYDSDNTGFYLNPNGTSVLNLTSTYLAGKYVTTDWADGFRNTPTQAYNFHGDVSSGGPSGTWWFYESMRHSNSANYWGTQIAWGWEDNANRLLQRNVTANTFSGWVEYLNTSDRTFSGNLYMTGSIRSTASDVRAPIFYDQDNTGYYVNPAATSYINALNVGPTAGGSSYVNINGYNAYGGTGFHGFMTIYNTYSSATNPYQYWRLNGSGGFEIVNSPYNAVLFTFTQGGDFTAAGNVTAYSDKRLKDNIAPINNALDKVLQLNGVTFTRIDKEDTTQRYAGLLAQDVEVVLPEAVQVNETMSYGEIMSVDYNATIALLVEAIKEQQLTIASQSAKINTLEAKLDQIIQKLEG